MRLQTLRRRPTLALVSMLTSLGAFVSCGTIEAVSRGQDDVPFPGVRHDLSTFGLDVGLEKYTDPDMQACGGVCFAVPAVIHGAFKLADLPLSAIADSMWMTSRAVSRGKPAPPAAKTEVPPASTTRSASPPTVES